jgi:hypothetical protein
VLLTSVVTLFLVPCGYMMLGDLLSLRARQREPAVKGLAAEA